MFKIVKKAPASKLNTILLRFGAIILALLAAMLLMLMMGYDPLKLIGGLVYEGAFGNKDRIISTLEKTAIPLTLMSLGILVAFKMKFWNIGAEGQFYMGAFAASFLALNYPQLPPYVLIPLMMLAGMVLGGLWATVSAFLKIRFGTSETLVTLMMNYIALKWVSYLQYGPWKDPKAFGMPKVAIFDDHAWLPKLFNINIGWIAVILFVFVMFFLLRYSKFGYEISVFGENPQTAKYAGMNNNRILLTSILISGGFCGLAGMVQSTGIEHTINDQMSGGLGFTAIIVAWLSQLSAIGVLIVGVLFAALIKGGDFVKISMQVPAAVVGVLQGIILFFVLGCEFFLRYKVVFAKKLNGKAETKEASNEQS